MLKLKQGMAAIVLVASLGLIVPGSFGGPAAADVNSSRGRNPNLADIYYFDCDVVGVAGDYETRYELASTFNAEGRHIQGSNLVLMSRYRYDIKDDHYEVINDPTGTAVDFDDPDTYWFNSPGTALPNDRNPKGWKTVLCRNEGIDLYAPNREDVEKVNPKFGLSFVQTDECLDDPSNEDENCVVYEETWTNYWAVTLSQGGKRVSADNSGDTPSADRAHPAKKHGKHRGKGKSGR
jgi:hypothetical protein